MEQLSPSQPLEAHPAAEHFPLLSESEFAELKCDIAKNGLLEAIWLYEGKILDGRNRYRACIELCIKPVTRDYLGSSPVEAAWSLNGQRRHLTVSQRAAIAVKMLGPLKEEARKRQETAGIHGIEGGRGNEKTLSTDLNEGFSTASSKGRAIDEASRIVGVGPTTIQYAKVVHDEDPSLFEKIERNEMSVDGAYNIIKKRRRSELISPPIDAPRQPREKRLSDIRRLASEGNRTEQIAGELKLHPKTVAKMAHEAGIVLPDAAFGKSRRHDIRRVIEETVISIEGCALGLQTIDIDLSSISATDAKQWADSMQEPLKSLTKLRKKLLEIAQ